ncbi:hypothetical protein [Viridibacterium curvum]|uniref:ABC transporter ATP-binding protein n=1 Tax=Viridibacterium curvum TaxID=1101404 RepID=A0ABP9QJT0_9RHOO
MVNDCQRNAEIELILRFDEATSALDSEVEAATRHSFYSLMQSKAVITIAHRLSTIAAMDLLLAQGGLYARQWDHPSGGFLGEEA